MITEDQTEAIALLAAAGTHGGASVERIDTHSAIVFLAGERAYKLKRAVRFDYLDFSTPERRRRFCEAEVRLNRRTAPSLYRGVIAITRGPDGALTLGGSGEPVDWVVEMVRFPQDALFDRLAAAGRLDLALMPPLAAAIAEFHAAAGRRSDHGGRAGMSWVVEGNAEGFVEFGAGIFDAAAHGRLTDAARAAVERLGGLLDARREAGFVRHCHGDLHLRNIVLLEGRPTLFDGVEFNDEISCTDVLYDLAFLLMDLWRRSLPRHANAVWNRYMAESRDWHGIPALPLFLSCRAAVRAKTSATAAGLQREATRRGDLHEQARQYLQMAGALLRPPPPCLIAVGGLSGSGKSTLAYGLSPIVGAVPGALVLRSDEIRKELYGVAPTARLGPEGYTSEASANVYRRLTERAEVVLRAGHGAIVDAVHAREDDRRAVEAVARDAGAPFIGLWLDAPEPALIDRVARRRYDPSDADAAVVRMQRAQDSGTIGWHRLDASLPADAVLRNAVSHVRTRAGESLNGM